MPAEAATRTRQAPRITGARFQAVVVDHVVALAPLLLVAVAGSVLVTDPTGASGALVFSGVLYVPCFVGYKTVMEGHWGRTLGKASRDLAVELTDGRPCTWRAALVRNLLLVVDFLPAWYFLGAYVARRRDDCRRVGDVAADTIVVRREA